MGRSTAKPSSSTSRRSSPRPSRRAMSSSWTTSAATKEKPPAPSSEPKGAHLIFLPPYSPDLNPIEQVFAKLKHLVRNAQPRDVEATWRKVGQLLDLFSPAECANYLANSGYGSA